MKTFKTFPESFTRKGMRFVKSNLTEKQVKKSGKSFRRVTQLNSDRVLFYIREK